MIQIKYGSTNQTVRAIQYLLGITADGIFGPKTQNAVKSFQKKYKLVQDGIVGIKTYTQLAKVQKTLKIGSSGNAVKALQTIIGVTVDGKFGPITADRVEEIQALGDLVVDAIVGIKTWTYLLTKYEIGQLEATSVVQPIDYKQGDSRWAKVMYSNHGDRSQTIANSGCGVVAVADILATWFDSKITPIETAKMAVDNGFRTYNSGTAYGFFDWIAKKYPFKSYKRTDSTTAVCKALTEGAYVIANMGPGFFTKGGHYICLWKYNPTLKRIYVNDPASKTRTYASYDTFAKEEKEYFIYFK